MEEKEVKGHQYLPLSLQMGTVTAAVDDLVHGYEHLVHSLPNVSKNLMQMHGHTEDMARNLEVRHLEPINICVVMRFSVPNR